MISLHPKADRQRELLYLYPQLTWLQDPGHLPPHLAEIFRPFADLAWAMADALPSNPVEAERVRLMIQHLEKAKNYAVQARVGRPEFNEETEAAQGEQVRGD